MQQPLALNSPLSIAIGNRYSMQTEHGITSYFLYLDAIDQHPANDLNERKLRIAKFADMKVAKQSEIAAAFGVSRTTVHRSLKLYREQGSGGFFLPRQGRGRVTLNADTILQAQELLSAGHSGRQTAQQLNIAPSTFSEHCRAGVITRPEQVESESIAATAAAAERSQRDRQDKQAAMGRAAHAVEARVAASIGELQEVKPQFAEPALAVPCGGVLAALPTLLKQGLLFQAATHLKLPKGYYGLNTVLLLVALLTLARMRNAESLRYLAPGEWGRLLGLDRAPEVKTLRRKLKALSNSAQSLRNWQAELTQSWLQAEPDRGATLAVDGHVKVYAGRKGKLPNHFISRQKLCLPAAVSYWINALGGMPLLCVHQQLDPKMCQALERDLVPQLQSMGTLSAIRPDLTELAAEPDLTLVFDREGWSPSLFKRLAKQGLAVITWHKGSAGVDWAQDEFVLTEVQINGPASTQLRPVRLAQNKVKLKNGLEVRQIRRLLDNGRQAAIVTTHPTLSMAKIAGAMFSRWSQENFFKTMRQDFNLDALSVHQLAAVDEDLEVVNPKWRESDKRVKNLTAKHHRALAQWNRFSQTGNAKKTAQYAAVKQSLETQLAQAKEQRKQIQKHIRVGELPEDQRLDALPSAPRQLLDTIRMTAYRAETTMMPAVMRAQGKKTNARKLLSRLFQCEANIIPQPEKGRLRIQFLGMASNSVDRSLLPLIEELNATLTQFPDTNLTLFYELAPVA